MSTAQRVRPVFTVTRVSPAGGHFQRSRYTMTVSTLPGQASGPQGFAELCRDLTVSALLSPAAARDVALAAFAAGTASVPGDFTTARQED